MLDESRTQAERITQMHTDALNNEMEARREYWQLAQNRQEHIGELLRENFIYRLLIQRKDTQIAEHRRTTYRLTVCYNNDTERWMQIIFAKYKIERDNIGIRRIKFRFATRIF